MSAFRKALGQPDFVYDFAIIPEASLQSIQEAGEALGPLHPEVIGPVARSIMELVGDQALAPDKIATVYHFGGSSALETVEMLKNDIGAPTEELAISDCFALFKFWKRENAILAKPPLSRFYGLFVPADRVDRWGVLWSHTEPLILVASKGTLANAAGQAAAKMVQETIEAERQAILKAPENAVRAVQQSGFVRYCGKLLGSKGVA